MSEDYVPPISSELAGAPISKFMNRNVKFAMSSTSVKNAMQMMLIHDISSVPIVDDSESCIGIYTDLDAILQGASQTLDKKIHYTKTIKSAFESDTFRNVLLLMAKNRIKQLPVVDRKKKLVGLVSRKDLLKAIFKDSTKTEAKAK